MPPFKIVFLALLFTGCQSEVELDASKNTLTEERLKLHWLTNVYPSNDGVEKPAMESAEFVSHDDMIILSDLGLVLRKVAFDKSIDGNSFVFFSETEITNQMFATYLSDTNQMRDDSELETAVAKGSKFLTTSSPAIYICEPTALWRNGEIPVNQEDHPVSFVTIGQGMDFSNWLNDRYEMEGVFRLPADEEWLFAAYGLDRMYPWGDNEKVWNGRSSEPVKARRELRTPEGLYGMWGNVSEFVLSSSDGYGGQIEHKYSPFISTWLGTSYKEEIVRGQPTQPRQDYWGYTHSLSSRSDQCGFRVVFVPQ